MFALLVLPTHGISALYPQSNDFDILDLECANSLTASRYIGHTSTRTQVSKTSTKFPPVIIEEIRAFARIVTVRAKLLLYKEWNDI